MPAEKLISKGAEAYIYLTEFLGLKAIKKVRIRKKYRSDYVDIRLRKSRTKREAKLLFMVKKRGIPAPSIYDLDLLNFTLVLEFIEGRLLRDVLVNNLLDKESEIEVFHRIGRYVGLMHNSNIIHGDLTTSNIMLTNHNRIVFIDFGLGGVTTSIEDKGIELRVLYTSLNSKHYDKILYLFEAFLEGYRGSNPDAEEIIKKFHEISKRGRYIATRRVKKFTTESLAL